MKYSTLIFFITCLFFLSCGDDDDNSLDLESEVASIEDYVSRNNLMPQQTSSGIYYTIDGQQTGEMPSVSDVAVFHFTQFLMDGTVLVNTREQGGGPAFATISQLLMGLQESFLLLREGDSGTFLMPSTLAFGNAGGNGVPANTPVGFEIELLELHDNLLAYETSLFEAYLADNNLTAETTASGLQYVIEIEGEGGYPALTSNVMVNYRGFFLNGNTFDASRAGMPAEFLLGGVIEGWQEGIQLFQKGGKGLLLIPSALGYGPSGVSPNIPPNTPLLFEVELVDFN